MPIYTFRDKNTDETHDEILSMYELDEFLENNPHLSQVITTPTSLVHEKGTNLRVPDSFRETMSKIKDRFKIHNIKDY